MPTYLDSGRSHHSHEGDWVSFGGVGAAAQAAVVKRYPGTEPETTESAVEAARRREQPPSRSGGGSTGARKAHAVWKTDGKGNFGISGYFRI